MARASPGCAFGAAAVKPLHAFLIGNVQDGYTTVRYRHHAYRLECVIIDYGEAVRCSRHGVAWVQLDGDTY